MNIQTRGVPRIRKVVITRSREGNLELASRLVALGFEVTPVETMELLPPDNWSEIDASLRRLEEFDWLVLTSAVGARAFVKRMRELGLALPWKGRPAVAVVGEKTRDSLTSEGVRVDFVPSEYLTQRLASELPTDGGGNLLLLRADIADPGLVRAFEHAGLKTTEHAVYRTTTRGRQRISAARFDDADAIVFGSPSAVEGFVSRLDSAARRYLLSRNLLTVCIGPVTARAAKDHGFQRILTPATHTFDGAISALMSAAGVEAA